MQSGGQNIGDLLNTRGVTWGFFEGGFDLTTTNPDGSTGCARSHTSAVTKHEEGRLHSAPSALPVLRIDREPEAHAAVSMQLIGHNGDPANHQYDIARLLYDAVNAGNFPAVSFLKAPGYQDGHAGYSDPLDEQTFVVKVINFLQQQRDWKVTAVIIAYDDSDGWYDHQLGQIVNQSPTSATR